jgi:hypothetical protein
MYKNTTKYNKTQSKWCIKKHGASKIIDMFETYHKPPPSPPRDRENPGALPGTLPERGIPVGGLLHHYGRLRSDV